MAQENKKELVDFSKLREKIYKRDLYERKFGAPSGREKFYAALRGQKVQDYKKLRTEFGEKMKKKQFEKSYAIPTLLKRKRMTSAQHNKAITGFVEALLPQEMDSGYGSYGSSSGSVSGRGRGRPTQSFTPKMLPNGQIVRMPVQAFKRASTAIKAQMRMQQELQKARVMAQPQMPMPDHVRGYGGYGGQTYDEMDQFLDRPSGQEQMQMQQMQEMQMPEMQQGYPQQYPGEQVNPKPGFMQNMMRRFSQPRAPRFLQDPYPVEQSAPMSAGGLISSRMNVWGTTGQATSPSPSPRNNILNAPNIFNKQGEATIGIRR